MAAKIIFFFFSAKALLASVAFSQCTSRAAIDATNYPTPYGLAAPAMANTWSGRSIPCDGYPTMDFTPTSGGGLTVTSASAIPPTGISVVSENVFEGVLAAAGELPFVGTTVVEGVLTTGGAGAINHACGNGVTAMASETAAFAPVTIAPAIATSAIAPAAAINPAAAIATSAISPAAAISPASPFTPGLGLGLGNKFGFRGCGGRGLMY